MAAGMSTGGGCDHSASARIRVTRDTLKLVLLQNTQQSNSDPRLEVLRFRGKNRASILLASNRPRRCVARERPVSCPNNSEAIKITGVCRTVHAEERT